MSIAKETDMVSRRNFLTGAGVVAAGAAVAAAVPEVAHAAPAVTQQEAEKPVFDGMTLSIGHVVHDPDLCCGCRDCELVCSLNKRGVVNPRLSNARIKTDWLSGYISEGYFCKQCAGAECLAVCPTGALHTSEKTGARVIDADKCVGCKLCMNACPATPSRIHYDEEAKVCYKCDLCDGDPTCVAHCPMEALSASWIEEELPDNVFLTDSGITVTVDLTGAIMVTAPDAITYSDINAVKSGSGVTVSGHLDSTYSQPFTAKIKASYFNDQNEVLFFADRIEREVGVGGSTDFDDTFETTAPDDVAEIRVEIMCGKISG